MDRKTLAWWDSDNFGDALNPYIFRAFGLNVSYQQSNTSDVLALGSLAERLLKGAHTKKEISFSSKPVDVWGSGFHFEIGQHIEQPDIELPEKLIRKVNILALRGEVSKKRMETILDSILPEDLPLGDPGLLLNNIIRGSRHQKYDLGIVPHFHDESADVFKNIHKSIPNSILLDPKSDPVHFIKRMTQCRAIISSALHPLVVADSYGIPNLWVTTGCAKISSYKYQDYYSVFDYPEPPVFRLNENKFEAVELRKLKANYSITREQVSDIQERLIHSFPGSPYRENKLKYLGLVDIVSLRWRVINRKAPDAAFGRKVLSLIRKFVVPL